MKLKKLLALSTATVMAFSMVGCGSKDAGTDSNTDNNAAGTETGSSDNAGDGDLSYANLKLGRTTQTLQQKSK